MAGELVEYYFAQVTVFAQDLKVLELSTGIHLMVLVSVSLLMAWGKIEWQKMLDFQSSGQRLGSGLCHSRWEMGLVVQSLLNQKLVKDY